MDLVDQIEEVRAANNRCWVDLLRLALEARPEETKEILAQIRLHDHQIQKLMDELVNSD